MNTTEKIFIGRVGIVLMGMLLFGFMPARAYDFKSGDLWYNIISEQEKTVEVAWFEYSNSEPEKYENVVVPASVQFNDQTYTVCGIGEKAFYAESKNYYDFETPLKTVELPSTIQYLGHRSFEGCTQLTEINFPEGLTRIGDSAFRWCRSLENVFLPNTVTRINYEAFAACKSLKTIHLSENLTKLPVSAFLACVSLESIKIPDSVLLIDDGCFHGCYSLKEITLGANTQLGERVFEACLLLSTFNVPSENPYYSSEGSMLLSKDKQKLILFTSAKGWVKLPEGLTSIENRAFSYASMDVLELPSSISYLEDMALPDNVIGMVICHPTTPPDSNGIWFTDVYGDPNRRTPIYVPTESYELYRETKWIIYKLHPMSEIAGVETIDTEAPASYRVVSLDGKIVMETQNRSDLESLPKGIYIVNGKKIVK